MTLAAKPEVLDLIERAVRQERAVCAKLARDEAEHCRAIAERLEQRRMITTTNMVAAYKECAKSAERVARAIETSADFTTQPRLADPWLST